MGGATPMQSVSCMAYSSPPPPPTYTQLTDSPRIHDFVTNSSSRSSKVPHERCGLYGGHQSRGHPCPRQPILPHLAGHLIHHLHDINTSLSQKKASTPLAPSPHYLQYSIAPIYDPSSVPLWGLLGKALAKWFSPSSYPWQDLAFRWLTNKIDLYDSFFCFSWCFFDT